MGFFDRNPNEVDFVGGKKHWTDVIKNSGPGELLIWRQPEEDFNTNSTLVVMPGEQAVFINGGNIEQSFEKGTYKLSTENYPFISRLRNAFTGGISTFNCVVYFVRMADSHEIRWGTDSPIQVRDKMWGVRTDAKVRGAYKVRIENPALFLEKLVGNNISFQTQEDLNMYFASEFQGKIKSAVSKFLNSLQQELIGIDAYMDELAQSVEPFIDEVIADYGLKCVKFSLAGLDIDITKYDAIDTSQIELIARQRGYQGDKAGLEILGTDWARIQGMSALRDLANNPGAGGLAAAGAGVGMGMGAANVFGTLAQQVFAPINSALEQPAPPPMQQSPSGKYTQKTAATENDTNSDPMQAMVKLKQMLDAGYITQEVYDAKSKEILDRM